MLETTLLGRWVRWMRTPEPAQKRSLGTTLVLALLAGGVAAGLRLAAAPTLPLDWDEGVTLRAAYVYADAVEARQFDEIPRIQINNEHPPAVKILYGVRLSGETRDTWDRLYAGQPVPPLLADEIGALRSVSAWSGAAQAAVLALANPLAGFFLAFNSYHLRYTAEMLLEGVAGFFAVASVLLFGLAWRRDAGPERSQPGWPALLLSAVALGLAAASKYMYGLPVLVLFPFLCARSKGPGPVLAFAGLCAATFVAAHPGLWQHPWQVITGTLAFHSEFASEHARPWWHPLALAAHATYDDHHARFFGSFADRALLVFAVLGLPRTARLRPIWFVWALVAIAFLLLWPTKWAHYQLLATPPLAMCAAYGVTTLLRPLLRRIGTKQTQEATP